MHNDDSQVMTKYLSRVRELFYLPLSLTSTSDILDSFYAFYVQFHFLNEWSWVCNVLRVRDGES